MSRDWRLFNVGKTSVVFLNKPQKGLISIYQIGEFTCLQYRREDLFGECKTEVLVPEAIFSIQEVETLNYRAEGLKFVKVSLTMKGGELVILHVKIQKT